MENEMDIKFIRLLTGEDLVAQISEVVVEENENSDGKCQSFKLRNPARLIIAPDGLGMGPLCPFSKGKEVEIKAEHIVFIDDPEDEIRNAYNSQFGSGIITASAGALSGIDIVR